MYAKNVFQDVDNVYWITLFVFSAKEHTICIKMHVWDVFRTVPLVQILQLVKNVNNSSLKQMAYADKLE